MATQRARRDLITRRSGSPYFYVRLQYNKRHRVAVQAVLGDMIDPATGEKIVLKSDGFVNLETTDFAEARSRAQPYLTRHFDILALTEAYFSKNPDGAITKSYLHEPGTVQKLPDGGRFEADEKSVRFYPAGSKQGFEQPNPVKGFKFIPLMDEDYQDDQGNSPSPMKKRPHLKRAMVTQMRAEEEASTTVEDKFFDLWRETQAKKDKNAVVMMRREFTVFVGGRAIADCKRDDASRWIKAARDAHVSDGTIGRKVAKLCAFVNWTNLNHEDESPFGGKNIFEKHKFNTKELSRPPFSEADIKVIRENQHEFTDQELLMITVVGTMSVRPSGIAEVRHCSVEEYDVFDDNGVLIETKRTRCLHFPKDKTTSGKVNYGRRVLPVPQKLLDLTNANGERIFPDKVTGPLFPPNPGQDQKDYISDLLERINDKFDRRLDITTPDVKDPETGRTLAKGKVFYSLRHRAKDVLEKVGGERVARAAMGHERSDVHHRYGHSTPLHEMKEAMDKVPF